MKYSFATSSPSTAVFDGNSDEIRFNSLKASLNDRFEGFLDYIFGNCDKMLNIYEPSSSTLPTITLISDFNSLNISIGLLGKNSPSMTTIICSPNLGKFGSF